MQNETKSVLCEKKICTLRNENLYFCKMKSVLYEMITKPSRNAPQPCEAIRGKHAEKIVFYFASKFSKHLEGPRGSEFFGSAVQVFEICVFVTRCRNTFGRGRKKELVLLGHEKKNMIAVMIVGVKKG